MSSPATNGSRAAQRMETAGLWLVRLREDNLSEAEMSAWVEWCESDLENLRAFEQMQSLWRAAAEHAPDEEAISKLMEDSTTSNHVVSVLDTVSSVRRPIPPSLSALPAAWGEGAGRRLSKPHTLQRRIPLWTALAASLVLAVAVTTFFITNKHWSSAPIQVAANDVVRTPKAQNREANLPDGSRVDLGARSVLDVDFSTTRRQLKLRDGQAFFQVKQDKNRPFVVGAGALEITAIGTAFDVRRTPHEITVTVQEGKVKISSLPVGANRAASAPATSYLTAGQQLIFNLQTGATRNALVDPSVTLAWRAGRLEFTGDTLDTVIASVNRYSSRPVVLEDRELGELVFTGTVFVDSIDASLDGLEQIFPVTVRHNADREIVLSRNLGFRSQTVMPQEDTQLN